MGLLKILFVFNFILFIFGEIARFDLGNNAVIKPIDIGVGLFLLVWLFSRSRNIGRVANSYLFLPIFLFAAISLASLMLNSFWISKEGFLASSLYLLRWSAFAGMYFAVKDFDLEFKRKIFNILLFAGSAIVFFGYLQYFFYPNLRNLFYLGWDEHMYRMFSTFLDPNFAGVFFVLFFLLIANLFLKKKSILTGFLLVLTLSAIFLTFSRSALVMLIISSSLLFVLMNKKILILLMFGIIAFVLAVSSKYFSIENINLFRTVSSEARLETAQNAIKIIKDNPIFGVGFNAYRYAQLRYGFRNDKALIISHADAGTDNSLLFVLATTGVVGFTAYLFLWYRILKQYLFDSLAISSIFGLFISSLFINSLFYPSIMLWIWTLLAITEKK